MQQDKVFNVTLRLISDSEWDSIMGIVKAENMPEALRYLGDHYPNHSVQSIEETTRIIL